MKTKLSENARAQCGQTISIKWGVSRGRDTAGYTTASLRNGQGVKVAACNGGGYDMRGTVLGHWIAHTFAAELCALKLEQMPENSHWQPERARVCAGVCRDNWRAVHMDRIVNEKPLPEPLPRLADDCWECPVCKGHTEASREGKKVDDGRGFYGLCFYDPNYDPGKAVVGKDCNNRSLGGADGKTVDQLETEGTSFGLERLQAFYKQTSKHATERHTIPTIDGACGESSVLRILNALGLCLRQVVDTKKLDVYIVEAVVPVHREQVAA